MASLERRSELVVESADTYLIVAWQEVVDLLDLILQRGEVGADAVLKVADMIFPSQFDVETGVENLTRIDCSRTETDLRIRLNVDEQVSRHLSVPVQAECQTVVEEACIKTKVILLCRLPCEVRVGKSCREGTGSGFVREVVISAESDRCSILVSAEDVDITIATPGSAEFHE